MPTHHLCGLCCTFVQVRAQLSLYLSDDDVGAVLGRKGQNLVDIQQVRLIHTEGCICHERHLMSTDAFRCIKSYRTNEPCNSVLQVHDECTC